MSVSLLIPSVLMGKDSHQSSDRSQPKKATQAGSSLISKALSLGRGSRAPQTAGQSSQQNPTPVQAHDATPVRTRVPAVTSKARTTAPETDRSRPYRGKYPSTMRYRPQAHR